MSVQIIMRDGVPEYAVLPWDEYQKLVGAQGPSTAVPAAVYSPATLPRFDDLAVIREAKGMSQDALARSAGISPVYLNLIESGERDPGEPIRRALARALEIDGWEQQA
ncbi:XRE family transcriptional regulator [Stutzerimonas zhaodongensis]|uniref:XRE family transcriptional regulator n=1 Tax=Stutzerimonas zhaodongensis TaxID=1176257 RepID=A0A3M2HQ99_9GAMM|nr:helix-turn-helix transcriptional regulator [Stutzerimonas zhaodongensis]MCQ4316172.1 helix-turn-helix transcriptional regulator [Stutzerimonas zhaodongensis]RMH89770.1 XRE family transcriptional regulator [Stutzerimonas zhaodongensis]